MKGEHKDEGKSRVDLIPADILLAIGDVFGWGAKKYAERNWEEGILFSKLYGSAMRHAFKWFCGVDYDDESGLHHLDCTIANLMMIRSYKAEQKDACDDRPVCQYSISKIKLNIPYDFHSWDKAEEDKK